MDDPYVKMLTRLVCLLFCFSVITADCPDFTFKCPTGEGFTVGTCWSWKYWNCQTCRSIISEMKSKCRKYSCGGSVENWYNRNDGCSAPVGLSGPMTEVFRAACAIHDICYATPDRTQSQCDDDFKANMRKTCRFPGIGSIGIGVCEVTALVAHKAVRDHGHIFPDFARTCTPA